MGEKEGEGRTEEEKEKGKNEEGRVYYYSGINLNPNIIDLRNVMGVPDPNQVLSSFTIHLDNPMQYTMGNIEYNPNWLQKQNLDEEISKLKKENAKLLEEITQKKRTESEKGKQIDDLKKNYEELSKKQRLKNLLDKVNPSAQKKLLESEEFRKLFEQTQSCPAAIMSVDIRRSTELMLKARQPQLYAEFIIGLCAELRKIIIDNYGVFDKFTGDGILAFYPDFYSGVDAPYLALKAADECHSCFIRHYQQKRNCFNSVLKDIGLGIGIDYGYSHLVKIQDELTVIGSPVVYACRMSGAKAGQTLLNQPAYEVMSQKFGEYVAIQETEIDIKHEGSTVAYLTTLNKKAYEPKLPDWLNGNVVKK